MSRLFQDAMNERRIAYENERRFRFFRWLPWPVKVVIYLAFAAAGAALGFLAVVAFMLVAG